MWLANIFPRLNLLARLACLSRCRRDDEVVLKLDMEVKSDDEICEVIGGEEANEGEDTGGEEAKDGDGKDAKEGEVMGRDAATEAGLGDNVICSSWFNPSTLCIIPTMI